MFDGAKSTPASTEHMMRLLVVGAGSTGGYFGGRLAQAGRDVTFLVRPQRAAQLAANGLEIVSPHGGFTLTPKTLSASSIDGHYDAILLAVKAYSLEAALEDFAPAVGPRTMILPVLNGMRHADVLTARFGGDSVLGGVCRIAAHLDSQGRVVQIAKFHDLAYGEMSGAPSHRLEELDAFMQNAGFNAKLSSAIGREMWEKWAMLATLGGVTCLMRGSVGEIAAASGGNGFINQFLDEVAGVVAAVGIPPAEEALAKIRSVLTAQGSALTSSMYRDLQDGSAIEADQIIGDLLVRARKADIPAPLLALAYTHLLIYQNRRAAAKD
jgi:2-dehydropantoate 2-reductase